MSRRLACPLLCTVILTLGCTPTGPTRAMADATAAPTIPPPRFDAGRPGVADSSQAPSPGPNPSGVSCSTPPPAGARLALPPKAYSGGVCPTLKSGRNTILSSGQTREFILVAPASTRDDEKLPVLFGWHWLKGSANNFLQQGALQQAIEQQAPATSRAVLCSDC